MFCKYGGDDDHVSQVATVQLKCNVAIARESRVRVDDVLSLLTFVQY